MGVILLEYKIKLVRRFPVWGYIFSPFGELSIFSNGLEGFPFAYVGQTL